MDTGPTPRQIPIFPSSDFDRTAAFHAALGFSESSRFGTHYLILEHPVGLELHFFGAGRVRTRSNDHAAYVRFDSVAPVEALHRAWTEAASTDAFAIVAGKAGRVVPLVETDYGLLEFAMLDSDGNLLRLGGPSNNVD